MPSSTQHHTRTHILGGCELTSSKLHTRRHNNTCTLFIELLLHANGDRWPLISMDLGSQSIKDLALHTKIEASLPQQDAILGGITPKEEGLQDDKHNDTTPTQILSHLLPIKLRPQPHKLGMVRAIGFTMDDTGKLILDGDHTHGT